MPPNEEDEDGPYYSCEYDDETGLGCDNTGAVPCPECENESREDTYTGDEVDLDPVDDEEF